MTRNVLHDNAPDEDLFLEVDHGPFLVDNNLFLSPRALWDMSQGGAYVHNLVAGHVQVQPELHRETPYHKAHSTEVAGLHSIQGGDDRFYNNIFVNHNGLALYDNAALPMRMAGNVFLEGAAPCKDEPSPLLLPDHDPGVKLSEEKDGLHLRIKLDSAWVKEQSRPLVTTELLGNTNVSKLPYEQPDGSAYRIETDYFGKARNTANPSPGPFELPIPSTQDLNVWPVMPRQ